MIIKWNQHGIKKGVKHMIKFDGSDYEHEHDFVRLSGQIKRVNDGNKKN